MHDSRVGEENIQSILGDRREDLVRRAGHRRERGQVAGDEGYLCCRGGDRFLDTLDHPLGGLGVASGEEDAGGVVFRELDYQFCSDASGSWLKMLGGGMGGHEGCSVLTACDEDDAASHVGDDDRLVELV